jgi:ribosomal protein S18 acetylase RimI-like enzyme
MDDLTLLRSLDAYLDAVPRAACRTETIGPFTLFVNEASGWRYYARPTPGAGPVAAEDVLRVREREREVGMPEAIEWVRDLVPSVGPAARAAGLEVESHPLMHLPNGAFAQAAPVEAEVRLVGPDDDLSRISAVQHVGFANPGTAVGRVGTEALDDIADAADPATKAFLAARIERGLTITAAAFVEGEPVAAGAHQPVDGATEVVGVACLPAFRRRGLAGAVTSLLVRDALERGVTTVCLSADDDDVERLYGRLGFVTVGSVGAAEPTGS